MADFDPTSGSSASASSTTVKPVAAASSAAVQHLEMLSAGNVNENLDDVLSTVKTLDERCMYAKCKAKTNLMGQYCEFCTKRFCFKHGLPEIHGCSAAVRRDERRKFVHPVPVKTVRHQEDLAKAKNKLHQKLNDMSLSRKPKPTGSSDDGRAKGGKNKK